MVAVGSVTGAGFFAGSGGGGGGAFRGENSIEPISSILNSAICPLARSTRTVLASALMNETSRTFPDRSLILSADRVALPSATSAQPTTNVTANLRMLVTPVAGAHCAMGREAAICRSRISRIWFST